MRRLAFALTLAAACKGSGSDDPAPPGPPVISIAPLRAREGLAAPVHTAFRATLDHASDSEVSVAWTTVDGTATAGEDYVAASGTLVFPPGATEATAAVDVLSDAVHEPLESFSLALSAPVGATLAAPSAAVEIQDDDADPRTSYEYQRSALWLSPAALRAGRPGGFVLASCVADFDGDGDDDVLLAPGDGSQNPMPVEFYRNDGGAFVYDASVLPQPTPGLVHARKCLAGDFDGDGRIDAFVTGHGYDQPPWPGEAPLLLLNGASGTFVQGALPAGVAGYE